jgi:hypothetical protein
MTQSSRFAGRGRSAALCFVVVLLFSAAGLLTGARSAVAQSLAPGAEPRPGPEVCDQRLGSSAPPSEIGARLGAQAAPSLVPPVDPQQIPNLLRPLGISFIAIVVRGPPPVGSIVGQWPRANQPIPGRVMLICVSDGQASVGPVSLPLMPGVTTLTNAAALQALTAASIPNVAKTLSRPHQEAKDTVFDQWPAKDSPVGPNDPVLLFLSDGTLAPPPPPIDRSPKLPPKPWWQKLADVGAPLWLLLGGVGAAAGGAGWALRRPPASTPHGPTPVTPVVKARLAGPPRATALWGDPPQLTFRVRTDAPQSQLILPEDKALEQEVEHG